VTRADLDAAEARAKAALADNWCNTPVCSVAPGAHPRQAGCPGTVQQWEHYRGMDPPTVLALVAELRAARAVVEAARRCPRERPLAAAVAAYDQAVGS
jgi:hypothetical protein